MSSDTMHIGTDLRTSMHIFSTQTTSHLTPRYMRSNRISTLSSRNRGRVILDNLLAEHDRLKQFVDVRQILISSVRRLPPEILQEISIHCLSASRNPVIHSSEASMLLTEVYTDWKKLALFTPALWSSLHLVFPRSAPALSDGSRYARFNAALAWFLPLSIYEEFLVDSKPTTTELLTRPSL